MTRAEFEKLVSEKNKAVKELRENEQRMSELKKLKEKIEEQIAAELKERCTTNDFKVDYDVKTNRWTLSRISDLYGVTAKTNHGLRRVLITTSKEDLVKSIEKLMKELDEIKNLLISMII